MWVDVKEKLPEIGQRVRVLVVKEMIYKGNVSDGSAEWLYDGTGEHRAYAWCESIRKEDGID